MKTRSLLLLALSQAAVFVSLAQTPIIRQPVNKTPVIIKQPVQTSPVILRNTNLVLNLDNGMTKYDPTARVKYIFYDAAAFTPVTGRLLPEANEYISLFTIVNGQEYTLVPSDDLAVERSAAGMHNVALVLSNGPRAAGSPTGPAVWKVGKNGNTYTLSYSGAFANLKPEIGVTGGYIGLQSGAVKISGGAAGITPGWQMTTVMEGGTPLLRLQNTGDSKFLGFSYMEGRTVANMPHVFSGFSAEALAATGCPAGKICGITWYYKIYTGARTTGTTPYRAILDPNTYMINTSYDTKSLLAFGPYPVFGQINPSLDEEQWRFEPTSRGTYFIINKKNNTALGVNPADKKLLLTALNTNNFYNTDNLQWVVRGPFDGLYSLQPLMDKDRPNNTTLTCKNGNVISFEGITTGSYWQQFVIAPPNGQLWGYIDMHTHPMSNYGFGGSVHDSTGEFFFGKVDGNPAVALGNCNCAHNYVVAPFDGSCGGQNLIRNALLDMFDKDQTKGGGYPDFNSWPKQSSSVHQQMWYEWVDRARKSGLRMIIALAQNSHTLADGLETGGAYDDLRNMNTQITQTILFVSRHRTIMDTVTTAARMRSVVQSGRLAVIIGIEMDNIGNFYSPSERRAGEVYNPRPTEAQVRAEIDRLYNMGVRYVFPIHIVNNIFGGAAVYGEDMEPLLFNLSNYYITGSTFDVEAVPTASTGIGFQLPDLSRINGIPGAKQLLDFLRSLPGLPLKPDVLDITRYSYPTPGAGFGQRNKLPLTPMGQMAVKYMMSKGIMIDVDHMSQKAVSATLGMAMQFDYPVNSGHNGPRGTSDNEKTRTDGQYDTLRVLGGMVGIGTGSAEASGFVRTFHTVFGKMRGTNVAIGTDVGVGAKLPGAPSVAARLSGNIPGLPPSHTGNKTWDFATYNTEGVDHYGLMPEFLKSLERVGMTPAELNEFYSTTEYFARMWEKCERNKRNVR